MKLKLLFLLFIFQVSIAQQRTCGMEQYMQQIMNNPVLKQQYLEQQARFEVELERLSMSNRNANEVNNVQVIRIPVAVHYPTAGAASAAVKTCLRNLAQKQLDILNADYNATNTDLSLWSTVSENYPGTTIGSLSIQFVLATQNHPAGTGLAEGSVAVTFGTDFLTAGNPNCSDGCNSDTTWSGYMNLVVTNISGGILGYSPLGGSPGSGNTVVIDNNSFGAPLSPAPATCTGFAPGAPYNKGRTLTHELGHFFNLRHTFQSCDGSNCASSGDRVCDTPSTDAPRYDCNAADNPPDPNIQGNPPLSTCGFLQLTMNYMDYVEDACMYMFTTGQATRMQAWYNFIASQFSNDRLSNNQFFENSFSVYPNPNKGSFNIDFKELLDSYTVEVFDVTGQNIYENRFDANSSLVQTINLQNTAKGVYFINIKSDNGKIITKKLVIE